MNSTNQQKAQLKLWQAYNHVRLHNFIFAKADAEAAIEYINDILKSKKRRGKA